MNRISGLLVGIAAAVGFVALTSVHLEYQGVYYDELHQAAPAFRHLGKHPSMFSYEVNDMLILNMTYSGAIKSHLYGLYLRYFGGRFTIYNWRMFGILIVALSLLLFYWIGAPYIPPQAALVFAALMLTDATVILTSRFDFGPTALALGLRLALLLCWLSMEAGADSLRKRFTAGLIVGVAVFEKLVATVLLGPLVIILSYGSRKLGRKVLAAPAAGLLLATTPLIYANYSSYKHHADFISLYDVQPRSVLHVWDAVQYSYEMLALGHGRRAVDVFLAPFVHPYRARAEAVLMLAALAVAAVLAIRRRHSNKLLALAGKFAAAYALTAVLLFLLPHETKFHHWIEATPFQYAAIAFGFAAVPKRTLSRATLGALVAALLLLRLPNIIGVERSLAAGESSVAFDPSFTRLAEFAAAHSKDAVFIAADWGTGTQIYCFSNGDDDLVHETFWEPDPAGETRRILNGTSKAAVYVLTTGLTPQFDQAAKDALDAVIQSPGWTEVPAEGELQAFRLIHVRKFARTTSR